MLVSPLLLRSSSILNDLIRWYRRPMERVLQSHLPRQFPYVIRIVVSMKRDVHSSSATKQNRATRSLGAKQTNSAVPQQRPSATRLEVYMQGTARDDRGVCRGLYVRKAFRLLFCAGIWKPSPFALLPSPLPPLDSELSGVDDDDASEGCSSSVEEGAPNWASSCCCCCCCCCSSSLGNWLYLAYSPPQAPLSSSCGMTDARGCSCCCCCRVEARCDARCGRVDTR